MAGAGAANSRYVPRPKWRSSAAAACLFATARDASKDWQGLGVRRAWLQEWQRWARKRRALGRECEVHEVVLSQEGKAEMDEMGDAAMVNGWTLLHS
jgi:hypothetical protein